MLTRLIIAAFVLINLKLPYVSLIDILLICFLIFLLISSRSIFSVKQIIFKKYKIFFVLIFLTVVNYLSPKLNIEEAHSIFVNDNDIRIISEFLPPKIINDIKDKFKNFDVNRMIKSHSGLNTFEDYKKIQTIINPYAYSADSFFQNNNFSRRVNKIDFSSREELRLGHLNTLKYNLQYDKKLRRTLPFYVLYEIPKIAINSKICIDGNAYYYFSQKDLVASEIQNKSFTKIQNQACLGLKNGFEKLYVVGFSINEKDNISILLHKNILLRFLDIFKYIIIIIIIFSSFLLFQLKFCINSLVYFISFVSTFLWAFIKDPNQIFGVRYFRGGADGLLHNSYAQDIVQNLNSGDYLLALRGGTDVFYNMPGLRFFGAISKLFFGDTNYAYLLVSTLLPFGVFIFLRKYLNKKYALIFFISFVFVPIFENMGFGYFNYIWQATRNHAETLSITLIVLSLIIIIDINDNSKKVDNEKFILFLVGLALSFAAICRPNFFPATLLLTLYIFLISILKEKYLNCVLIFISFSTIALSLIHNIYFGQSFYFFTNSHIHNFPLNFYEYINGIKNLFLFNFQNENLSIIFKQFSLWNPMYNIHRLLILFLILYFIIKQKQSMFTYFLFISAIAQHGVLLITFPSSRYSYLAWLLTFILFLKIEFDNQLSKYLYLRLKTKYQQIKQV